MGDGNRATFGYLFPEERNHGTVRAQNISETGSNELSHALDLTLDYGLVQALAIDFANTLAASHHIGRVHRLVSGNHHELLHTILDGEVRNHTGAPDIVLDGLGRVILHHRDVLVSRSVENEVRLRLGKKGFHLAGIRDAGNDGGADNVRVFLGHHQPDIVHWSLGRVYQNHTGRLETGHLTHHFGADRAGRSCDEHHPSRNMFAYLLHIHLDFLAWQQVLDLHLAKGLRTYVAPAVPLDF